MKRILAVVLVLILAGSPAVLAAPGCSLMAPAPGLAMAMANCCAPEACGDCRMQEAPATPLAAEAALAGLQIVPSLTPAVEASETVPMVSEASQAEETVSPENPRKLYDLYSDYRI